MSNLEEEAFRGEESEVSEDTFERPDASQEISLGLCLKGLEVDFKRGIVMIDENEGVEKHQAAFEKDRTAGTTWEALKERLLANESHLLKKATTMQGQGELIGVFKNGELCIIDRSDENGNREPVMTAFDAQNNRITITTDTPNRVNILRSNTENGGRFANYWEIRDAVIKDGFTLPPDSPSYEKKGIVAAIEAVTGNAFIRSNNGQHYREAILECGDVSKDCSVRVVYFRPRYGRPRIHAIIPSYRSGVRGAVRVLRG